MKTFTYTPKQIFKDGHHYITIYGWTPDPTGQALFSDSIFGFGPKYQRKMQLEWSHPKLVNFWKDLERENESIVKGLRTGIDLDKVYSGINDASHLFKPGYVFKVEKFDSKSDEWKKDIEISHRVQAANWESKTNCPESLEKRMTI